MAFTKDEKAQMIEQYEGWLAKSQAVFLVQFTKVGMKEVNDIRAKAREAGGEMHVVKNTLFSLILEKQGIDAKKYLDQTTMVGFAFNDAPQLAKVVSDASKTDFFKVKAGLLGKQTISAADVKSLADMPPLPVVRAQLLGILSAPAAKLVRTINEPARSLAAVVQAHTEKEGAPAAEAAE